MLRYDAIRIRYSKSPCIMGRLLPGFPVITLTCEIVFMTSAFMSEGCQHDMPCGMSCDSSVRGCRSTISISINTGLFN